MTYSSPNFHRASLAQCRPTYELAFVRSSTEIVPLIWTGLGHDPIVSENVQVLVAAVDSAGDAAFFSSRPSDTDPGMGPRPISSCRGAGTGSVLSGGYQRRRLHGCIRLGLSGRDGFPRLGLGHDDPVIGQQRSLGLLQGDD
jgi:hypothetical protein